MSQRFFRRTLAIVAATMLGASAAGCDTAGSSTSDSAVTSAAAISDAKERVATLEHEPTTIPATTPLPRRPDPGKTLVALKCEVPQCALVSQAIEDAATAAGWNYVAIPFKAYNPATLAPALKRALTAKPVATILAGTPQQLWENLIPEYERANVALIPYFVGPTSLSKTVPVSIAGTYLNEALSRDITNWLVADSNGKANVLIQDVGGSPSIHEWTQFVQRDMASTCPGCKVSVIHNSGAQATGGTDATTSIVSRLRSDPSIDYFITYNGAFIPGLAQAAKNAGLKVKVGGVSPLPQNIKDIMDGTNDGAWIALNAQYVGWISVDAALRHSMGAAQLPDAQTMLPVKLVTSSSVQQSDLRTFTAPANYPQRFHKLWKVN